MIKSGNRYLRYYLLEAANSVRRCDSEFRRYYDLKFKEVKQVPAQTRTRFNCQKTGPVGLSTAERQPPVYPAGELSEPFAALVFMPCFKFSQGQGLDCCCLFASDILLCVLFYSIFPCITLLT